MLVQLYDFLRDGWFVAYRVVTFTGLKLLLRRLVATAPVSSSSGGKARLLYVPASCLPYHTSGYTTRTHAVIRALIKTGLEVRVLTRCGYPWDRRDSSGAPDAAKTVIDGVEYQHVAAPNNLRPLLQFVIQASSVIAKVAVADRVAVIHAASNHVNALPALYAARRLGIPFFYEMRGLWELTKASRFPGFDQREEFRLGLALEGFVAQQADRVFVISEQLAEYAQQHWGIPREKIALLPNCVDPDNFVPGEIPASSDAKLVYAGSLIGYEGLDTLLEACALLRGRGVKLRLQVVGHGEAQKALVELAERLALGEMVSFLGKLKPEQARAKVLEASLVCIPRKPYRVCEIIPPIKLVEALAMAKPVVVPDLPVFRDELSGGDCAWFFRANDPVSLADTLEQALRDRDVLVSMGKRAREYAEARRNWQHYARGVSDAVHCMGKVF